MKTLRRLQRISVVMIGGSMQYKRNVDSPQRALTLPCAPRPRRLGISVPGICGTAQYLLLVTVISLCMGLVTGCGGSNTDSGESAPLTSYIISPAATGAAIDPTFGDHYVYINPAISPKGKLFVFMAGTGSGPSEYQLFLQAAANNGFHTIGLAYDNSTTVEMLCSDSNDPNCHGTVREEILTGQDVSPAVSVDLANSIDNRLTKALLYLAQQHPADGWGQYLDANGNLQWNMIRISGHSQGGGEACYIAKKRLVDRVCFFSSPGDFDHVQNKVAAWVLAPGATPAGSFYGFAHERDGVIPLTTIQMEWPALQMDELGTYVNVDNNVLPYGGSHMLLTNLDKPLSVIATIAPDAIAYHNITAADAYTPLDSDGLPIYRATWQYQCFQ